MNYEEQYEKLWGKIEDKDKEIKRLKERLDIAQTGYLALDEKINKAIEYIDRRDIEWGSEEHTKLLNILEGDDKDGKN